MFCILLPGAFSHIMKFGKPWLAPASPCLAPEYDVHTAVPRHCSAFSLGGGGDATLTDEHNALIILRPQHMPFSFNTFGRRAGSTLWRPSLILNRKKIIYLVKSCVSIKIHISLLQWDTGPLKPHMVYFPKLVQWGGGLSSAVYFGELTQQPRKWVQK